MDKLIWELTYKLSDDTKIKDLEKIAGISLPSDYIDCVLENNEGYPSLKVFKTQRGVKHIFNNLLSLDESEDENVFKTYQFIFEEMERKDIIPFARDSFGNYICFDFSESAGKVVFWDNETNTLDVVSETFTELIDMLSYAEQHIIIINFYFFHIERRL